MRVAVSTCLACRRPAFFECAVTIPTVRYAGQELADHLVGAACDKAWLCTTTVFRTETLAFRRSGAARHRAQLLLASAVSLAMRFFSRYQTSGATCKLALSIRTMLAAETACCSKCAAAFHLAHFRVTTTVLVTPSP